MYHTARAVISQIIGGIITLYVIVINHFSSSHTICHRQFMTSSTVCCVLLFRIFKWLFLKNSSFSSDEVPLSLNGAQLPSKLSFTDIVSELPLTQFFLVFWRLWVQVQHRLFFTMMWGFSLYALYITHRHTFQKQPHTIMVSHSKVHCGTVWFFYDRDKLFLSNVIILFFSVGKLSIF